MLFNGQSCCVDAYILHVHIILSTPSLTLGQRFKTSVISSPQFAMQYNAGLSLLIASMHVAFAFNAVRAALHPSPERHAVLYAAINS